MSSRSTVLLAAFVAVSSAFAANTWYVDDDNYNPEYTTYSDYEDAGLDGKSEEKAFGTIQIAVDKASYGDKIIVLPGTYDKGLKDVNMDKSSFRARIYVSKGNLWIEAKEGKAVTHIVGAPDPDTEDGIGPKAAKCVHIGASGVVFQGFTFRGGRSGTTDDDSSWASRGCAVGSNSGAGNNTIVDCAVYDIVSEYSAVFQVNCVRCEVYGCRSLKYSNAHIHAAKVINSYIHDNTGNNYLLYGATIVNSTIASEPSYGHVTRASKRYNSVFEAASGDFYPTDTPSNVTYNAKSLFAPAAGDCHPCVGMDADKTGDAELLAEITLPDGVDQYIDFEGVAIPKTGKINLGCFQTSKSRAGGRIDFTVDTGSSYSVDGGYTHKAASYLHPGAYPTQYMVTAGTDARLVKGVISGAASAVRAPDLHDTIALMPPAAANSTITFKSYSPTGGVWVASNGNDDTGDGTEGNPYQTIQKAIDEAPASTPTIVNVRPGVYGAGEAHYPVNKSGTDVTTYGKASVTIYDKCVRVVSTDGPEETFIVGTADPDYASDETLPGCGPNAARCVLMSGSSNDGSSVAGFTLTGGATARSGNNTSWGGGYFCPKGYNSVVDCIVSNNAAHVCAGGYAGVVERCLFAGNKGDGSTAGGDWSSPIFGCVFAGNPSSATANGAICGKAVAYNCTLIGESADYPFAQNSSDTKVYNSIVVGGGQNCPSMTRAANVLWGGEPDLRAGEKRLDPVLVDAANGDFRVRSISPAVGAGDVSLGSYFAIAATGFGGDRVAFLLGAPLCGAVQKIVSSGAEMFVEAANGGIAVDGGDLGYKDLSQTGAVTLVPTNGTRPCVGYLVNGVTNLFADLEKGRLVVTPEAAADADGINVRALYDNNWYVDANNGSDGNPGCAAFPMLTLVEGTRHAASGDTVHAAPGDYNQGATGDHTGFVSISSRVVVVSGVLLVADEGPDVTFITGADSPTPVSQNQYLLPGGGPGAVRCVFLEAGAKISGFTVRHGRQNGGSTDNYDGHSAGILGRSSDTAIAYNCVITNCCGYRGGATYGILAVNCHISGCRSGSGSAGRVSGFVGCVFGGDCNNNYIDYPRGPGARNCTFLGPNIAVSSASASYPVCNSIILGRVSASSNNPIVLNNCILNTNAISATAADYVTTNNCVVCADDLVGLNADGMPQQDSIAVDAGSNTLVSAAHNGVDIAGSQRVYNGTVDIGAYEYDWRPEYAAAINDRQCAVVKASPEVTLGQDGKVSVVDTLAMTLRSAAPSGRSSKYSVPVSVTGNGTLTVTLNGEEYGVFDQGDYLIEFKNALASNDIVLNYAPGAEDTGSAIVDTSDVVFNGAIILLK